MATETTEPIFDGGGVVDGGCCQVAFAVNAYPGEVAAAMVWRGQHLAAMRQGDAWRVNACVGLISTEYYFEVGLPTDDDAGILWTNRVNDAVKTNSKPAGGPASEVNVFDVPDASVCTSFDGGIYSRLNTDAGTSTPMDSGMTSDGGNDAGIDAGTDAGTDAGSGSDGGIVKSVIGGACDTLVFGSATRLLDSVDGGVDLDEDVSSVTVLPFAFKFFGTSVTHYAATSNGLMYLYTNASGGFASVPNAVAIPSSANPNGFIAPLWDDLTSVPGTVLQAQLFGSGSARHLTVEWWNYAFYLGSTERVTFQVKLFETTNAIELHYCGLQANGATATFEKGFGASTGIESLDGTRGVQHSFKQTVLRTDAGVHFE